MAMLAVDSIAEKYKRRSTDKTLSADEAKAALLIVEAEQLLDEENDEDGLAKGYEALALCKQVQDKTGIVDSIRLITHVLIYQSKRKEASQLVKEELEHFRELCDKAGKAKLMLAMGEINSDQRGYAKRDEGLEQSTEALNLFLELGDKKMEASALLTIASIHIKRRPDKMAGAIDAFNCCAESLKIARNISDKRAEACALHGFATTSIQMALLEPSLCLRTVFYDPGFEDGLDAAKEALRIWRELGCKNMESYELQCLAQWQLVAGHPEEALPDAEMSTQIDCKGHRASSLGMHVQALIANRQNEQALKIAEEALDDFRNKEDVVGELHALDMLTNTYRSTNRLQEAYETAELSLDLIRDRDDIINEMRMQCTMGHIALERKEYQLAMDAADEMVRISEELHDAKNQAIARHMIAEVHRAKGDTSKYLKETKQQQKLFASVPDEKGLALAYLDECDARFQKAEFEEALEAVTKAQDLYKEHGDKTGEASALHMVVEIQQMLDNGEAVLKASARQRSLLKSIGDKRGEAASCLTTCYARLYQLSTAGHSRGSAEHDEIWGRAFREAKDGLTLANTLGDESLFARAFYMLAEVYVATTGKGEEALQCSTQAVKLYKEGGDAKGEASAQVTLGHAHHLLGKQEEALEAAQRAQQLFTELGDEGGMNTAAQAMAQFSDQWQQQQWQGDWAQGYDAAGSQPQADNSKAAAAVAAPVATARLSPEAVSKTIVASVTAITMMDEDLDGDTPLMQAGLTSNTVVLLRNELSQNFPQKHMPFTLVFDFPSVNAISEFICE